MTSLQGQTISYQPSHFVPSGYLSKRRGRGTKSNYNNLPHNEAFERRTAPVVDQTYFTLPLLRQALNRS
jgi:hypothetical protein